MSPILFLALSIWIAIYSIATRPLESLAGLGTLAVGLGGYRMRRLVRVAA